MKKLFSCFRSFHSTDHHYFITDTRRKVIAFRVNMINTHKTRGKALGVLAKAQGVIISVWIEGEDMLTVVGEGQLDAFQLAKDLRKKVGSAEIVEIKLR